MEGPSLQELLEKVLGNKSDDLKVFSDAYSDLNHYLVNSGHPERDSAKKLINELADQDLIKSKYAKDYIEFINDLNKRKSVKPPVVIFKKSPHPDLYDFEEETPETVSSGTSIWALYLNRQLASEVISEKKLELMDHANGAHRLVVLLERIYRMNTHSFFDSVLLSKFRSEGNIPSFSEDSAKKAAVLARGLYRFELIRTRLLSRGMMAFTSQKWRSALETHQLEAQRLKVALITSQIKNITNKRLLRTVKDWKVSGLVDFEAEGRTTPKELIDSENAAVLCRGLNKLEILRQRNLNHGMNSLVDNMWRSRVNEKNLLHELEVKKLNISRMIASLRGIAGRNMQRVVSELKVPPTRVEPPACIQFAPQTLDTQKALALQRFSHSVELARLRNLSQAMLKMLSQVWETRFEQQEVLFGIETRRLKLTRLMAHMNGAGMKLLQRTIRQWQTNSLVEYVYELESEPDIESIYRQGTLSDYEKRLKILSMIKALINKSQLTFEQAGFWRWRLKHDEFKDQEKRIIDGVIICTNTIKKIDKFNVFTLWKERVREAIEYERSWRSKPELIRSLAQRAEIRYFKTKQHVVKLWTYLVGRKPKEEIGTQPVKKPEEEIDIQPIKRQTTALTKTERAKARSHRPAVKDSTIQQVSLPKKEISIPTEASPTDALEKALDLARELAEKLNDLQNILKKRAGDPRLASKPEDVLEDIAGMADELNSLLSEALRTPRTAPQSLRGPSEEPASRRLSLPASAQKPQLPIDLFEDVLDSIMERTKSMTQLPANQKLEKLKNKAQPDDLLKQKMQDLVENMKRIHKSKEKLPLQVLFLWKQHALLHQRDTVKSSESELGIAKLIKLFNCSLKFAFNQLHKKVSKPIGPSDSLNPEESEMLKQVIQRLAKNSRKLEETPQEMLSKLKAHAASKQQEPKKLREPATSRYQEPSKQPEAAKKEEGKASIEDLKKTLIRGIFKTSKNILRPSFNHWKSLAKFEQTSDQNFKILRLLNCFNRVLAKKATKCFRPPKPELTRDEMLIQAMKRICRNLHYTMAAAVSRWKDYTAERNRLEYNLLLDNILNRSTLGLRQAFSHWARYSARKFIPEKVRENLTKHAIKILIKQPKECLQDSFTRWKYAATLDKKQSGDSKVLHMVSILSKTLNKRAERVFHPPVKSVSLDETLKKLHRKLKSQLLLQLETGLDRWKIFVLAARHNDKLRLTDKILSKSILGLGQAFYRWACLGSGRRFRNQPLIKAALRNLKHQADKKLGNAFNAWKIAAKSEPEDIDHSKMVGLLSILQRKIAEKGKRVFHPPIIVKDADAILTRNIKKLRSQVFDLQSSAMLRWKNYLSMLKYHRKMKLLEKVANKATLGMTQSFYKWANSYVFMRKVQHKSEVFTQVLRGLERKASNKLNSSLKLWSTSVKTEKLGIDHSKTFAFLSILTRKVAEKAKRVFHPPKIVKDADFIMHRAINRLKKVKLHLYEDAISRWKSALNMARVKQLYKNFMNMEDTVNSDLRASLRLWQRRVMVMKAIEQPKTGQIAGLFKLVQFFNDRQERDMKEGIQAMKRNDAKYRKLQNALKKSKAFSKIDALDKLKRHALAAKAKKDTTNKSALQLALDKIFNARLKFAFDTLDSHYRHTRDQQIKLVRILIFATKGKLHNAWDHWKNLINSQTVLRKVQGALNLAKTLDKLSAQRLNNAMNKVKSVPNKEKTVRKIYLNLFKNINEDTTRAFLIWKLSAQKEAEKFNELKKHGAMTSVLYHWVRNINLRLRRGFNAFKNDDTPVKRKICQAIKRGAFGRLAHAFDKMKENVSSPKAEQPASKLASIFHKLVRKPLLFSFIQINSGKVDAKPHLKLLAFKLLGDIKHAFKIWKDIIQKNEIAELKNQNNSLKNKKKQAKLRASRAANKNLNNSLKLTLVRRALKEPFDAITRNPAKLIKLRLNNLHLLFSNGLKDAMFRWKLIAKESKLDDSAKGNPLKDVLNKIARRPLRDATNRLVNNNDKEVKHVLNDIFKGFDGKLRFAFLKWKGFMDKCKEGSMLDNVRGGQLNDILGKLCRKPLRAGLSKMQGDDKPKIALKNLHRLYNNRPRDAFNLWKQFVNDCKTGSLLDNVKANQLKLKLEKVPRRTLRDTFVSIVSTQDRIKSALRNVELNARLKLKVPFDIWKNYLTQVNKGQLLDALNAIKLRNLLSKLARLPLNSGFDNIVGTKSTEKLKSALKSLSKSIEQAPAKAFYKWRDFINACQRRALLNAAQASKLKNHMERIPMRTLNHALSKLTGDGSIVAGALRRLAQLPKTMERDAFDKWKKFVNDCNAGKLLNNIKAAELRNKLEKLTRKPLRVSLLVIVGSNALIKAALRRVEINAHNKLRDPFYRWRDYLNDCKTGSILDALKANKLKAKLESIAKKPIRQSLTRIIGGVGLIKPTLRRMEIHADKILRQALQKLKDNIAKIKQEDLQSQVKGLKLKSALDKPTRKQLRSGHAKTQPDNKWKNIVKLLAIKIQRMPQDAIEIWKKHLQASKSKDLENRIKADDLHKCLENIPKKTLRVSLIAIRAPPDPKVPHALKNLDKQINNRPRAAFNKWARFLDACKKKELLDQLASTKLINLGLKIPTKTLRDALSRIIGLGDKVAGALKRLEFLIKRRPVDAFNRWNNFNQDVTKRKLLNAARSSKLAVSLGSLPKRTIKDALDRVLGDSDKVAGALRRLALTYKLKPKEAFDTWKNHVVSCDKKAMLDSSKSEKLRYFLFKISIKTLRDTHLRIIGDSNKSIGILRTLFFIYRNKPRFAFNQWRNFVNACDRKTMLDNLKSNNLKLALGNIPRRTLRNAVDMIKGDTDKVATALRRLKINYENRTGNAFYKWFVFVKDSKAKVMLDELHSQKLKNKLANIANRVLRDSVNRMIGKSDLVKGALKRLFMLYQEKTLLALIKWREYREDCRKKLILDALKSQKLKNALGNIPKRTLKDATERIIGNADKVKGVLRRLQLDLLHKCKDAFIRWKDFKQNCDKKLILDSLKTQKLKLSLSLVPKRTLRDALDRVVGDSDKVAGTLRRLQLHYNRKPKEAFDKWKDYLNEAKKKNLLNALNAQKLKDILTKLCRKPLKSAHERVLGDTDKVTAALRRLELSYRVKPREAFELWKNFKQNCDKKLILDSLKTHKLKLSLSLVPKRTLRDALDRVVGDANKVAGILRRLQLGYNRKPKEAFDKWKDYLNEAKKKNLLNALNAQKLKDILTKLCRKPLKSAHDKVLGDTNKVTAALRRLELSYRVKPREAFELWKNFKQSCDKKLILNALNAQKLKDILTKLCRKPLKSAHERVLGDTDKVTAALRRLELSYRVKPREAFELWKNFKQSCDKKLILDSLKTQKLKLSLSLVPKRTLRDALDRVVGDANKVNGVLRRLQLGYNRKPKEAFDKWKDYLNEAKKKNLLDALNARKLKDILTKLCRKPLKAAHEKVLGDTKIR
jgi:hypothetical protein